MKTIKLSDDEESDILVLKISLASSHFYLIAIYAHPLDKLRRMNALNLLERYLQNDLNEEQVIVVGDFNTDLTINKKYSKDEQAIFQNISNMTKFDRTSDYTWVIGGNEFKERRSCIDYVLS